MALGELVSPLTQLPAALAQVTVSWGERAPRVQDLFQGCGCSGPETLPVPGPQLSRLQNWGPLRPRGPHLSLQGPD